MSTTEKEAQTLETQLDTVEPPVDDNPVVVGKDDMRMVFVQKPLSFFGKMELFAVLAKALDDAMSGEDGLRLDDLLELPDRTEGEITAQELADADLFVRAVAKLVTYAPELLSDVYCISLGVPRGRRTVVKALMELPVDEGGLSDEDGVRIFETFLNQNAEALVVFFTDRAVPAVKRAISNLGPRFRPSKPSNRSQRRTRKGSSSA